MEPFIKNFINKYQEEINNNEWTDIYKASKWQGNTEHIGAFTEMMLDCGINPLKYLTEVPMLYLINASHAHDIIIPEGVERINGLAFYKAIYLRSIYIPLSVKQIKIQAFNKASIALNDELEIIYPGYVDQWREIEIHPQVNFPTHYKIKTLEGYIR